MTIIGEKLHKARLIRGYSVKELSQMSGIKESLIVQYECEESEPSNDEVFTFSVVLRFPIRFFTTPIKDELEVKNTFF